MMKILFTMIISGFLFISVSAFASGYSQTQNNVDDKKDSSKPAQSNPADKNGEKESQSETYGKQKMEKKDADPRGGTEENKGNLNKNAPY